MNHSCLLSIFPSVWIAAKESCIALNETFSPLQRLYIYSLLKIAEGASGGWLRADEETGQAGVSLIPICGGARTRRGEKTARRKFQKFQRPRFFCVSSLHTGPQMTHSRHHRALSERSLHRASPNSRSLRIDYVFICVTP